IVFATWVIVKILKYLKEKNICINSYSKKLIHWFAIGDNENTTNKTCEKKIKCKKYIRKIIIYFILINLTYITWGVIQERMMTIEYSKNNSSSEKFDQSEFIVLSNRCASVIVSGMILVFIQKYRHDLNNSWDVNSSPPFYKYGYSTFSNLTSSWCQYEALKYISFPLQVLAKSCKIVPVMMMGTCVSRKKYTSRQYVSGFFLTIGILLFTYSTSKHQATLKEYDLAKRILGYILLMAYLIGDNIGPLIFTAIMTTKSFISVLVSCLLYGHTIPPLACLGILI
ncbi:hypothetical protein HZS_1403, partial [Henneguya salminicola]